MHAFRNEETDVTRQRLRRASKASSYPAQADDATRSTARPPFDPVEYARESERNLRAAQQISEEPITAPGLVSDPAIRTAPLASELRAVAPAAPPALTSVPVISVAREDLEWFDLDEARRELLDRVDGISTLAETLDRARDIPNAANLLQELAKQGMINFVED
jgi:hypothetical protein